MMSFRPPVGTHQPGLCYNDIDMFPRTRRSVPGADRTDGKPSISSWERYERKTMFLEPIARTGKSLDQFSTQIARTDMSYVTAILYPRATLSA